MSTHCTTCGGKLEHSDQWPDAGMVHVNDADDTHTPTTDWYKSASGNPCPWCADDNSEFEPFDSDDADATLCRGHVAEFEGMSLDGLDHMESEIRKDMNDLGYFD